jgi:hypothetical protein
VVGATEGVDYYGIRVERSGEVMNVHPADFNFHSLGLFLQYIELCHFTLSSNIGYLLICQEIYYEYLRFVIMTVSC